MTALASSVWMQGAIVYALFLREMNARYATSRLGYLLAFVDPVVGIAMVAAVRYYIRGTHTRHGLPMVLFVITGYLVWYAFRHTANELSRAVNQKTPILMFPQVTVLDTILARAMLAWFTYMGVMTVLAAVVVFVLQYPPPKDVALMMFSIFMGLWLGGAAGILMGVSMRYIPALSYFYQGALRAGPFVSGALFTADELPQWLHPYLAWNPIFHACELIRIAWVPSFISPIANLYYPILCGLLATVAALLTERATRHFKFS